MEDTNGLAARWRCGVLMEDIAVGSDALSFAGLGSVKRPDDPIVPAPAPRDATTPPYSLPHAHE
ncbi:MAG TPA: hypothetical protein VFB33_16380 [Candidatus Binataceae bacterium]|nr:hypothetical protein [Candidatus Binataceae bacterium]